MRLEAWIGVDLDATLAEYTHWPPDGSIGKPIPAMIDRVKAMLEEGRVVKIFTARVWPLGTVDAIVDRVRSEQAAEQQRQIQAWCKEHIGQELPVTCIKDFAMLSFFDDRAVQVEPNTGRRVDGQP
ncbi:MAG: hypothetical protein QM757_26460 [Paludibaculum sp.]